MELDDRLKIDRLNGTTSATWIGSSLYPDFLLTSFRLPVAGHADYFPNSGALQPNCLFQTCSHSRSWQLYARSVLAPRDFPAVRCASWEAFQKGDCDGDIRWDVTVT